MKIEEEIKQPEFKSETQKLVVNLLFTGSWLELKNAQKFKEFGLTIRQFNVLRILRGQHTKPVTVNLIMERMLDKSSNASRIVDKLVFKKYVERKICPKDRRQVDVKITDRGLKLLKEIDDDINNWQNELISLTDKEMMQLNTLLDKLRG